MALAPSHFKRKSSSQEGLPWWVFLVLLMGLVLVLTPLLPYTVLRFEAHHLSVLLGFPCAVPFAWLSFVCGALGVASFAGITQRLFALHHKPLLGADLISSTSVGGLVMLLSPTLALLQWAFTMITLYIALRWWQWRVATHASPLSPWQKEDIAMGVAFGLLGSSVGVLPFLLCVGTLALWFLNVTSRRFSLLLWWENYRGVSIATCGTLILGTLLWAFFGRVWYAFSPLQAMPCDLSLLQNVALFVVNAVMLSFPWNGVILYAFWNWLSNLSYRGKEGQLFDERDLLLHQEVLWWVLCMIAILIYGLFSHADLSFALLLGGTIASWYGGHILDRSTQLLLPPKGLKRLFDLIPLFLLGLGVWGAWSMLTQLPDTYLTDAPWLLPGTPLVGDVGEKASKFQTFFGLLPLWKLWLLTLPLWCLIGSAVMVSLQFITFSMYRTMSVFAGWSVIYTVLLFAVQWPITHPAYMSQHHVLLEAFDPMPTTKNTQIQGIPPYLLSSHGVSLETALYGLSPENRFYQEKSRPFEVRGQAVQLLPVHYMGMTRSNLLYYSFLDILPFLSYEGVHHYVLEYLPVRRSLETAFEEKGTP